MLEALAAILQQTRQHHAIEHATIHLLAARFPRRVMAGMSDPWGFTLFGQLSTEAIEEAVEEAIQRLQDGEEELAFHPNCGTNFTTTILLATAAAFLGSVGWRSYAPSPTRRGGAPLRYGGTICRPRAIARTTTAGQHRFALGQDYNDRWTDDACASGFRAVGNAASASHNLNDCRQPRAGKGRARKARPGVSRHLRGTAMTRAHCPLKLVAH